MIQLSSSLPIEWNIHELIESFDPSVKVGVKVYVTENGDAVFLPIDFFGYRYLVRPSLSRQYNKENMMDNPIAKICFSFPHERRSRNLVLPRLRSGDTMIDVGACYGSWTLPAAAMGCTVYAFESDSYSRSVLEHHIGINDFKQRVRVGGHVDSKNSIDHLRLKDVKLIKIDTEGSEMEILDGCKKTIKRCKPNLLVELHTFKHGVTPEDYTSAYPQYHHHIIDQRLDPERDNEYYHVYSIAR